MKSRRAGKCPTNPTHKNTRIYSTTPMIRYCVCDDCGEPFKIPGPEADGDGPEVIGLPAELRRKLKQCADLLQGQPTRRDHDLRQTIAVVRAATSYLNTSSALRGNPW
jgi:hypothetical protein